MFVTMLLEDWAQMCAVRRELLHQIESLMDQVDDLREERNELLDLLADEEYAYRSTR